MFACVHVSVLFYASVNNIYNVCSMINLNGLVVAHKLDPTNPFPQPLTLQDFISVWYPAGYTSDFGLDTSPTGTIHTQTSI